MTYTLLASDYDGTLTCMHREVTTATLQALRQWKATGRKFMLVTGRRVSSLCVIFPDLTLCDLIVAENGGVIYNPHTHEERLLGEPPPDALIDLLQQRDVEPIVQGKSIISVYAPHTTIAQVAIQELELNWYVMLNKNSSMLLPKGVNKTSGLRVALDMLGLSLEETVGVGDAENDVDFLAVCGYSVAVANALPSLKSQVDLVTDGEGGKGVAELIERLLG